MTPVPNFVNSIASHKHFNENSTELLCTNVYLS